MGGIGTYAYKFFEEKMKDIKIPHIIASTHVENETGQKFFEKNKFNKIYIKNEYIRYVKKLGCYCIGYFKKRLAKNQGKI